MLCVWLVFILSPKYDYTTGATTTITVLRSLVLMIDLPQTYDTLFAGRVIIALLLCIGVVVSLVGYFVFYIAVPVYAKPLSSID